MHKLGHFGMCVTDFAKCFDFYSTYFNFFPSEVGPLPPSSHSVDNRSHERRMACSDRSVQLVHNEEGVNKTVFFRLDRGDELVDHHCFFFFEGPKMHVHHSSFETHDFDAQVLGHDWLRQKGYKNCWGVGRHVMGSQIFDYWCVLFYFFSFSFFLSSVIERQREEGEKRERDHVLTWSLHYTGSTRPASSWSTMSTATCSTCASRRTTPNKRPTTCMCGVSSYLAVQIERWSFQC